MIEVAALPKVVGFPQPRSQGLPKDPGNEVGFSPDVPVFSHREVDRVG
jgi:hypothetical protein